MHSIDELTGKTTWAADDASTFYNTAVVGKLPDGTSAVGHGWGGPHGVPELPVGLSMTSLAPSSESKSLWRFHSSGTATCSGGNPTEPPTCSSGAGSDRRGPVIARTSSSSASLRSASPRALAIIHEAFSSGWLTEGQAEPGESEFRFASR